MTGSPARSTSAWPSAGPSALRATFSESRSSRQRPIKCLLARNGGRSSGSCDRSSYGKSESAIGRPRTHLTRRDLTPIEGLGRFPKPQKPRPLPRVWLKVGECPPPGVRRSSTPVIRRRSGRCRDARWSPRCQSAASHPVAGPTGHTLSHQWWWCHW